MTHSSPTHPIFPGRERISLCMIVKNEARCLARCLRSAAPWVGEIIVVDTGSTDGTPEIAASFGARVLHVPWRDDFSAARNASLEAATRPWALILDADEELVMVDPDEAARAVQQEVIDGFSFRIHNRLDNGQTTVATVFRLFRRDKPGMRYRGAIHEQVIAVAEGGINTAALGCLQLTHDGYTTSVAAGKGKHERNVTLSLKLIEERPEDPFAWYALGQAYQLTDRPAMIRAYERCLALLEETGGHDAAATYSRSLYLNLAKAYQLEGSPARARAVADQAIARFPDSPDMRFLRGQWRMAAQDHAGAAEDFEACLSPEAGRSPLIEQAGTVGYAAMTALAQAWLHLGRHEEAEAKLKEAIAAAPPGFILPQALLGALLLQRGAWADALPLLQTSLASAPDQEEVRFNLGWCLYKLDRPQEVPDVLAPLEARQDVQLLLGQALLEAGEGEQALAQLARCELPAAGLARGWAYYLTGRGEAAASCWAEWLRAGAADWGTKDTLATFLFLIQGGRKPTGQPERPAEPLRDMDRWFRLLLRHRRFDDVEAAIQRGPELGPRLWRPLRKKWGATLILEGFRDIGTMLMLEAQPDEPEDPEIYYWLGVSSLEQRLVEDARHLFEVCLRLSPQHALALQALSLLR